MFHLQIIRQSLDPMTMHKNEVLHLLKKSLMENSIFCVVVIVLFADRIIFSSVDVFSVRR